MNIYLEELLRIVDPVAAVVLGYNFLKVIGILILSRILLKFAAILIDRVFASRVHLNQHLQMEERRVGTLSSLLKSLVSYALYFIAAITILDIFGIPVASFLAGAGILGLAVGFGAQNLVRDVISGFFIIFEDQFAVGDYVKIGEKFGMVTEIGLRISQVKAYTGELFIIPNGEIQQVTNFSRGSLRALVEVGIAYEENIENVIKVIEDACDKVYEEMHEVIDEKPFVQGVVALADSSVNIRVTGTATGLNSWGLERKLRQRIKEEFDLKGIEIPYPRRVVINGGIHERVRDEVEGFEFTQEPLTKKQ